MRGYLRYWLYLSAHLQSVSLLFQRLVDREVQLARIAPVTSTDMRGYLRYQLYLGAHLRDDFLLWINNLSAKAKLGHKLLDLDRNILIQ